MSKTAKILILLTSISLVLVIYIIVSSKLIVIEKETQDPVAETMPVAEKEPVDLELLAREYETEIEKILGDLDIMIDNFTSTSSMQSEVISTSSEDAMMDNEVKPSMLKARLMNITVPDEYRELHINIVLAVSKFEEYIETQDENDLLRGIDLVRELQNNKTEQE